MAQEDHVIDIEVGLDMIGALMAVAGMIATLVVAAWWKQ